ncbi:MAG TPA: enoyl-CoA hydratase/isomerase family protein [Burkholderiales bacterium]|jgi:enoyl-CoA hydratase/carnithine racemase|nr:enoyl-CoA hydratase/isomerase family protein [Burkholderiales bacterium]
MASSVKLERRNSTAVVVLSRPEVLNAVNMEMRETLITLLAELNRDDSIRALLLTGAGDRAFCSGQDLDEISRYTANDIDSWLTRQHAMYAAVRDLDKPCIVAFNGVAAGAGFQIALCADLRVGCPEMKLGQPEIKAGLASIVGSYLMTMHLGLSRNIELSLTGELISGQVAYEIGILNHLVPRAEVMNKALALAADMSKLAPTAMRLTKQRFRKLTQPGFEAVLEEAKIAQKEAYASGEPQEAIRKFLEARKSRKE